MTLSNLIDRLRQGWQMPDRHQRSAEALKLSAWIAKMSPDQTRHCRALLKIPASLGIWDWLVQGNGPVNYAECGLADPAHVGAVA